MSNAQPTVTTEKNFPDAVRQQVASPQARQQYRFNASLPPEAWEGMDQTVYPAMDDTLRVVADIRSAGLTTSESIFNKVVTWNRSDYSADATISMNPDSDGAAESDTDIDQDGVPLPVIHSPFSVHWREMGSDGTMPGGMGGVDLEQDKADASGRAVAEAAEDLVLNGWEPSIGSDGYSLHGLTNHPDVHVGDLADWTSAPGDIRNDLKDGMARDLKDDNFRPGATGYNVYISDDLEDSLTEPDPEMDNNLVMDTLDDSLSSINEIQVSEYLPDGSALMFRPTRDVIDLAVGLEETVVEWEQPHRDNFQVMMGFAPRVKVTKRGQCGVAFYQVP